MRICAGPERSPRDARIVWTGVAELVGLMPPNPYATEGDVLTAATSIDEGSSAVRDTERLRAALRELLTHRDQRTRLYDKVTTWSTTTRYWADGQP